MAKMKAHENMHKATGTNNRHEKKSQAHENLLHETCTCKGCVRFLHQFTRIDFVVIARIVFENEKKEDVCHAVPFQTIGTVGVDD